jgi:hypothetical protein
MTLNAIEETNNWLENWVIRLNLCPFAKYPYENKQVRIVATEATDDDEIFRFVLNELDQLYQADPKEIETTLAVIENGLVTFDEYLDFLGLLEKVIAETGLEGSIQLASFHPDYCFEGEAEDDPANLTNRSPFPMFHLIREESLEKALQSYPDPQVIPERNIALLREMYKTN